MTRGSSSGSDAGSGGLTGGAIAGIVIGVLAAVGIGAFLYYRSVQQQKKGKLVKEMDNDGYDTEL
jgi:hypothetical protein